MNKARATLTCDSCGKPYDPHDEKWQSGITETGISYFKHDCPKWSIAIKASEGLWFDKGVSDETFADIVIDALKEAMQ